MAPHIHPDVAKKFETYPEEVAAALRQLRALIYETAAESELPPPKEGLKWNEPSYSLPSGSPVRFDWKPAKQDHYALYFNCNTTLIATVKELYGSRFQYEGQRALIFSLQDRPPVTEVKHCIRLALCYHQLKHLPLLGAVPESK